MAGDLTSALFPESSIRPHSTEKHFIFFQDGTIIAKAVIR